MQVKNAYAKKISELLEILETSENGLTAAEAEKRLERDGLNKLPEGKTDHWFIIFLRQFESPLIYILIAAAGVILALGEAVDASIIFFVLFFNALVGTIQEGRAQNTLRALQKYSESQATVLRQSKEIIIPDSRVVAGDIIALQEGEKVPADARIIFQSALKVDEAALTGESLPVTKESDAIAGENLPISKQSNILFKGTHILSGTATALVIATGINTEIGRIAKEIEQVDTEIPLRANIRYLSRLIIAVVAAICAGLILIGLAGGRDLLEMFKTAVALSVSIIPEGLPIVMTLVLATGVWRMSKKNALVRKLQAVEALGQTKILAVDKTGTLTRNEMVIERLYAGGKMFEISGKGYEPVGEAFLERKTTGIEDSPELEFSARVAAYNSNVRLSFVEETKEWKVAGDPTEAAMLVFGQKFGFTHERVIAESPVISDFPFDYTHRYHATIHKSADGNFLSLVGAPEAVLDHCKSAIRKELGDVFLELAGDGYRVLAYAYNKNVGAVVDRGALPALTFGGFFAMRDALRGEVKEAVRKVKKAGMRIVMITGDHYVTARAIAKEAGIWEDGDNILTGDEIEKINDFALAERITATSVFARVTPEHKLRIIEAYRRRGEVVAMTGDGVNDAPSLVAADLGVAMGKIGTEVAKEAADIILLDDNFGSIVAAVEEGRSIYKTVKKVILYLFSTSVGEVFTIVGALMLGFSLPILPAQIIWLNFVTDGFLDVALAMEPKERGLLRHKFERPKKWIVDKLMEQRIFLMASVMACGTLVLFSQYYELDIKKALTISLTMLAVFQWFNAWNCRSESKSIFQMNPFSNLFLVGSTAIVIVLQLLALYSPFLQKILHTEPLLLNDWLTIISVGAIIIIAEEVRKFFYRRKTH